LVLTSFLTTGMEGTPGGTSILCSGSTLKTLLNQRFSLGRLLDCILMSFMAWRAALASCVMNSMFFVLFLKSLIASYPFLISLLSYRTDPVLSCSHL
jgi:hypothetical protein